MALRLCFMFWFYLQIFSENTTYSLLQSKKVPTASHLRQNEILLKEARKNASSGIGTMISLGHTLVSCEVQSYLNTSVLPMVIEHLPDAHFRVQKCYALLLTAAKLVSEHYMNLYKVHVQSSIFFFAVMSPTST